MKKFKKIFFILVFFSFLFLLFTNVALAQPLEIEYPQVPGAQAPTTVKTFLPEYIKFLFNFALIIAGLIAFASLVYGGFRYLASAGNPAAISDAKAQITAGILGLLLLLGAYLILIQLNPQLVVLQIGKAEFAKGVILYRGGISTCNSQKAAPKGEEGKDFLRVRSSQSWLGDPSSGGFSNLARSIYFYDSSEELRVKIFRERNYGDIAWDSEKDAPAPFDAGECFSIPSQSQSIQLIQKLPGVYLFADADCKEDPRLFITDSADFTGFHDKAKAIKIVPRIEKFCIAGFDAPPGPCKVFTAEEVVEACKLAGCQELEVVDKFGAVLHEHSDFRGDAEVFFGGQISKWPPTCIPLSMQTGQGVCAQTMEESYCREHVRDRASAITIFSQRPPGSPDPTGEIILYEHPNFNEDKAGISCRPFPPLPLVAPLTVPAWVDGSDCTLLMTGDASSIRVEGNYIAVLFREDGRGEVFRDSDLRLKDNHIGDNKVKFMLVIPAVRRGI